METIQTLLKQHYEIFLLIMGILFMVVSWFDWNLIFDPPYNSIKNPVGFWFGRKAYRFSWFVAGLLIAALAILVFYLKNYTE